MFNSSPSLSTSQFTANYRAPAFVLPAMISTHLSLTNGHMVSHTLPNSVFPHHHDISNSLNSSNRDSDSPVPEISNGIPLIPVPFLPSSPSNSGHVSSHSDSSSQATGSSNVHTVAPIVLALFQPHHPMQTRSKSGIFKPKLFTTYVHKEPATVPLALTDPQWKKSMKAEYQVLIHNHTWDLVPFLYLTPPLMLVIPASQGMDV